MSPITRLTAAAVGGVLLLATACGGGREGPAPQPPPTSSPAEEKEKDSIFDSAVRVAVKYDQPGFNFQDQETRAYAGFEKDLAEYLSSELKFTMDLKDEPSHRREKVLENGTSQLVIATYSITEDREEQVDFAGPYFQTRQGLLVRAGNKDITSRETTAGKVICTVSGSTSAPETSGAGKKLAQLLPKARVDLRDSYSQCVDQLRRGNFDAVWTDRAVLYGFMERYDDIKVVEKLELGSPSATAWASRKAGKATAGRSPTRCADSSGRIRTGATPSGATFPGWPRRIRTLSSTTSRRRKPSTTTRARTTDARRAGRT